MCLYVILSKMVLCQLLKMNPKKVIVLIRRKDKQDAHSRLRELLTNLPFTADVLRFKSRVTAVEGDITQNHLGLDIRDVVMLQNDVTVRQICRLKIIPLTE